MEKEQFLVKLRKLVELGRSKQNALDVAEINDFFTGDNLGPEQMDEIYSYLEHSNIDVVPISDDALLAEDDSLLMDDMDGDFSDDKMEEDIDLDAIDLLEGIGGSGTYVLKGDRYGSASVCRGRAAAGQKKSRGR